MPTTSNPEFWLALARGDAFPASLSEHSVDTELLLALAGLADGKDAASLPAPLPGRAQTLDLAFLRELAGLPEADVPTSVRPPPADHSFEQDVDEVEQPQQGIAEFEETEDAHEPEALEDFAAVPHAVQPATVETDVEQLPEQVLLPDEPVEESVAVVEELAGPTTELAFDVQENPRLVVLPTVLQLAFTILAVVAALAVGFVARGFWSAPANDVRTTAQATTAEQQQDARPSPSEGQLLNAITRAVGDPQAYRGQLEAYVRQLPGADRSKDFETVLARQASIWEDVQQWNELVEQIAPQRMAKLDAQGADELRKQLRPALEHWSGFPDAASFDAALASLDRIAARSGGAGQTIIDKLIEELGGPALAAPYQLTTVDGKRYFLLASPSVVNGKYLCEYAADLRSSTKRLTVSVADINRQATGKSLHPDVCQRVVARLAEIQPQTWERTFAQLFLAIREQPGLDPRLRVHLLRAVLETGSMGSQRLANSFAPMLDVLTSSELDRDGTWLDPEAASATASHDTSRDTLQKLSRLYSEVLSAAWDGLATAGAGPPRLAWVGWHRRDSQGSWFCQTEPSGRHFNQLYVARIGSAEGPPEMIRLDDTTAPAAEVAPVVGGSFVEGAPIFATGD